MIRLFATGLEQRRAEVGVAGDESLSLVESLRGDLPRMIDPHEAGDLPAIGRLVDRLLDTLGGVGAGGLMNPKQGSEGLICGFDQPVDQGKYPVMAGFEGT